MVYFGKCLLANEVLTPIAEIYKYQLWSKKGAIAFLLVFSKCARLHIRLLLHNFLPRRLWMTLIERALLNLGNHEGYCVIKRRFQTPYSWKGPFQRKRGRIFAKKREPRD